MYTLVFKTAHILVLWLPVLFNEEWTPQYICCARNQDIFSMLPDKEFIWAFIKAFLICILRFVKNQFFSQEVIVIVDNETGAEEQPNCAVMDAMATEQVWKMLSSRVFKSEKL